MASTRQLNTVDGLAQLAFLVHGALERRAAEHDVSVVVTRLLGILRDREPTMNELATLLGSDKSSVTGLVDRAERRGLVTRVPEPRDRRSLRVRLTPDGRTLITTIGTAFGADVRAALRVLPAAERADFARLTSQVVVGNAQVTQMSSVRRRVDDR